MLYAYHAGTDMPLAVFFRFVDYILEDTLFVSLRHESVTKRQQVSRNGVVAVLSRFIVKKAFVVRLLQHFGMCPVMINILRMPCQASKLHHFIQQSIKGSTSQYSSIRLSQRILRMNQLGRLGRHAPVTPFIAYHQSVFHGVLTDILYPAFHGIIVPDDSRRISIMTVQHFGSQYIHRRPCYIARINRPETRGNSRYDAVFTL